MIRNFIFHKVVPEVGDFKLEIDLKHFEKCIKYISNKYQVILLEDIKEIGSARPRKEYATLSFDDGYKDNLEYAIPVLEKYNCKGSFFVVSKCIEERRPIWAHELEYLFFNTHLSAINLEYDFLPAQLKRDKIPQQLFQRKIYFKLLKNWLKNNATDKKDIVYNALCKSLNDVELPDLIMSWKELNQLKATGHYIGAHSHSHNALTLIKDEAELRSEFELPQFYIRKHLGHTPVSFAYPFGYCNERIKKMAEDTGYQLGLAAQWHELYDINKHDYFEIPRIALGNEPWWKTQMRISNRIETIKRIVAYKYIKKKL